VPSSKLPRPKRKRLWLNDGSCIRLRAERPNHVWSYDFVHHRTHDGRAFRMLNIIDEFTRECLAIRVARKLNSTDVIDVLSDLFLIRGVRRFDPARPRQPVINEPVLRTASGPRNDMCHGDEQADNIHSVRFHNRSET
jgi:transposase InsO family protein